VNAFFTGVGPIWMVSQNSCDVGCIWMSPTLRLVGEDQALTTLNMLIARAELVTAQDIQKQGNPSLSHCIHHICLDSSITTPNHTSSSLGALQKLIEVDGLWHLSSLTLQVDCEWDGTEGDDPMGHLLKLPLSFFTSLKTKCPNLKSVRFSDFSQEFGKEWIEPHVFSIKVNFTVYAPIPF